MVGFGVNILAHIKPSVVIALTCQLLLFLLNWTTSLFDLELRALNFFGGNLIIFLGVIYFYKRTTIFHVGWTVLNLLLNVVLAFCEFGILSVFEDSFLFNAKIFSQLFVALLAAVFLAVNKVVLDEMFLTFGAVEKPSKD